MRQDRFERNVVVVRSLVVTPADVQPHAIGRNSLNRPIDSGNHQIDEGDKVLERTLRENFDFEGVPLTLEFRPRREENGE